MSTDELTNGQLERHVEHLLRLQLDLLMKRREVILIELGYIEDELIRFSRIPRRTKKPSTY